jgi:DNA-binding PadR family transcriptional regulator
MTNRPTGLSPLALVILALLDEDRMHPYRMQQLIRERGKDEVINVRHRASLYQTIARLQRDGLIEVHGTAQTGNRPERTLYQLTGTGRGTLHTWLREMLGTPAPEFPEFPAALSFIYLLEPAEARQTLARRINALDARRTRLTQVLEEHADLVPRLFLLEIEYTMKITEAELAWLRGIEADLESGRLTWSPDAIRSAARSAHSSQRIAHSAQRRGHP